MLKTHKGPGRFRVNQEMTETDQVMRDLAGAAVQILEHIHRNNNNNNHRPEINAGFQGLTEFKGINPPIFKENYNPEKAKLWI